MLTGVTQCPLCRNDSYKIADRVACGILNNAWKAAFNYDIGLENEYGNTDIELRSCSGCGLLYYAPQIVGEDRLYESLQKYDWYYLEEKEEYETALKYIQPDKKVLEIGCGNGAFARKLACASYVGLEMSGQAIKEASTLGLSPHKKIIKERVEDHARENPGIYDVVCAFQVLEHVPDASSFLESSLRCLKSGGNLIISLPSEDSRVSQGANNILNAPPHHLTRWTDACLIKLAELFDLTVTALEHEKLSPAHQLLYSISLVQYIIGKLFHAKPGIVDARFSLLPVRWTIRGLALIPGIFLKVFPWRPRGHSVTVIYKKK